MKKPKSTFPKRKEIRIEEYCSWFYFVSLQIRIIGVILLESCFVWRRFNKIFASLSNFLLSFFGSHSRFLMEVFQAWRSKLTEHKTWYLTLLVLLIKPLRVSLTIVYLPSYSDYIGNYKNLKRKLKNAHQTAKKQTQVLSHTCPYSRKTSQTLKAPEDNIK